MNRIDFTPNWYRVQYRVKQARQKRLMYIATMIVLMAGWLMVIKGRIQRAQLALAASEESYQEAVERRTEINKIVDRKQELEQQLARHDKLTTAFPKRFIISEIAHWLPERAWLVNMEIRKLDEPEQTRNPKGRRNTRQDRSQLDSLKFSELQVTITAQAEQYATLTDFVENLNESVFFEKIKHKPSRRIRNGSVIEKEITIYVIQAKYITHEFPSS